MTAVDHLDKTRRIRRERLQLLIDEYGSAIALANKLGFKSQSRISHMLGAKGMGESAARDIEHRLGLPEGWMDGRVPVDGRKPHLPEAELFARILHAIDEFPNGPKMAKKKRIQIVTRMYLQAETCGGQIDQEELRDLMALTAD
jgi:hypothetical protein